MDTLYVCLAYVYSIYIRFCPRIKDFICHKHWNTYMNLSYVLYVQNKDCAGKRSKPD